MLAIDPMLSSTPSAFERGGQQSNTGVILFAVLIILVLLEYLNFEFAKMAACRMLEGKSWAHNFVNETACIMESDREKHSPNRPKPVVTQGDAKLHLKINLCHMKRLYELMNENLSTLNDIFNDSSLILSDATKIRNARSTVKLLNRCFGQLVVIFTIA
jgi:hypothetical protein